jgi:hypothetical protein
MSATLFLAFCILGCDFLLYVLFQWTYGEKRRGFSRRSRILKTAMNQPDSRPFLVSSRKGAVAGAHRSPGARFRTEGYESVATGQHSVELRAHRRIAASLAQRKH